MTTRNFLSGIKAAVTRTEPPDWERRFAAVEDAIAAAKEEHGSAALAVEQQIPGSAARLVSAAQTLQAAQARKSDLTAAQTAWNAQEAEREAKARAAEAERQDKAAQAAFDAQAALAHEGEAILAAYVAWWGRMREAESVCRTQAAANPRVRQDLAHAAPLADLVRKEIARIGTTTPLPPGADNRAAALSDRREWQSLGDAFAALAAAVLPDSAQPKRSRPPR
jgi:hypothetical protein